MKLPRPQLHLSTCVVLMFAAGGLVWANIRARQTTDVVGVWNKKEDHQAWVPKWVRGWPAHIESWHDDCENVRWHELPTAWGSKYSSLRVLRLENVLLNVFVALAILAAVAFVCEWIIRRRARQHRANVDASFQRAER